MITRNEQRQLMAMGHDTSTMTEDEQRALLQTIAGEALSSISEPAPQPQPQPQSIPATGAAPDRLADVFMQQGIAAFKQAVTDELGTLQADLSTATDLMTEARTALSEAQTDLAAEQAKPRGDRVIIKQAASESDEQLETDLTEYTASELFSLPDTADYKLYASDSRQLATDYDFTAVHESGVLPFIGVAQRTGQHVWLAGGKGAGKTTLAQNFAKATGRPFHRIQHFKAMEPQDLIGSRVFDTDGQMVWADGQLTTAIREQNAVILLDEPTLNPAACELYQTILDEGYLTIPATGERVYMAPEQLLLAADNTAGHGDETGRYHGTAPVNGAFLDRFSYVVQMGYMAPEAEAKLLARFCSDSQAGQIAGYAAMIRQAATDGEVEEPISYRRLEALAIAIGSGIPAEAALTTSIFNHVVHPSDEEFYRLRALSDLSLDV